MRRTSRLPEDTPVAVRPNQRAAVLGQLPVLSMFAVTVVIAVFGAVATGDIVGVWSVIGLLCLLGWVLEVLTLRSEVAFGPALAADASHVWVRTSGLFRPSSVQLDWSEITGITLHTWRGRRGATSRYLTFDLVDDVRSELADVMNGVQDRRMRRLAATFGSPLAISEQYKQNSLDETVRGLRDLAPDDVRFTRS